MASDSYEAFLAKKSITHVATGIADPGPLSDKLKNFQRDITRWSLRKGRSAIWAGCGLGKSWMSLEWARVVTEHTEIPVLILTRLSVAQQFVREGEKLGVDVIHAREANDVPLGAFGCGGIVVTNYERLEKFVDVIPSLGGIVLDES